MMSRVMFAGAAQMILAAEECARDDSALLQSKTARTTRTLDSVKSRSARLAAAIDQTAADAEFVCLTADVGEIAPFPGTFASRSGAKIDVDAGYVAMEAGQYCVENSVVALMQRAASMQGGSAFEMAIASKGNPVSGLLKGKGAKSRFRATSKFTNGQQSFFTGETHSTILAAERKIADELNRVRRKGFTCDKNDGSGTITYAPAPHDLVFDCRLWWASKLHSEDMTIRQYYSHETKQGSFQNASSGLSGTLPSLTFADRAEEWAWGMPAHVEIILAYAKFNGDIDDADYAQKVVQGWLASPPHCNGIATKANQYVGVGGAWCPKASTEADSLCHSVDEADADGTGRWYWTALFTYSLPAATDYVRDDFSSIRGVPQPEPPIREIDPDRSCLP